MFGFGRLPMEKRRQQAWRVAKHPVMLKYLSNPVASPKMRWDEVDIVSLDFETTGLDPRQDQILSYGVVEIRKGLIQLNTAKHELIRAEQSIPESSAIIHHITDDKASTGRSLEEVLPDILHRLSGRVMLVHYNKIERGFLEAACMRLYGSPFMIPIIDTLSLAHRILVRRNHTLSSGALRLFNLRKVYKLPEYRAHNALYDAITTAELFMMLQGEINPDDSPLLKDLLD